MSKASSKAKSLLPKRGSAVNNSAGVVVQGGDIVGGEAETKHRINLGAFSAFRRISVWNTVRRVRVSGGNAPMKKDLKAFLEEKPEYVIWTGQRVAGAEADGDKRRVASKAKVVKKSGGLKLGKVKNADSQKSRFSALSRESMLVAGTGKVLDKTDKAYDGLSYEKSEKSDKVNEKYEKLDKSNVPSKLREDLFMLVASPASVKPKKEKKVFEASVFLPAPRRVGDRVRAKVIEDFVEDEEGRG